MWRILSSDVYLCVIPGVCGPMDTGVIGAGIERGVYTVLPAQCLQVRLSDA